MCALAESWAALNAEHPIELLVVGIDEQNQWFPGTDASWRKMTACEGERDCSRRVVRVLDPAALTREISRIATGGTTNLCEKELGVNKCLLPPGLREVHFAITGVGTNAQVVIKPPNGNPIRPDGRVQVRSVGSSQRWRILAPQKGTWRVESADPDAELFSLMLPVQLRLAPEPAAPTANSSIGLLADLHEGNEIHMGSLHGERFALELVHNGIDQPLREVVIYGTSEGGLAIESPRGGAAIGALGVGRWTASVSRSILNPGTGEIDQTLIGSVSFVVTEPAPKPTPTATKIPISASTPTPVPTRTPTPQTVPTPACNAGSAKNVEFSPPGNRVAAYRFGFRWEDRPRFRVRNQQSAILSELPGCVAVDAVQARLQIAPADGQRRECPNCEAFATSIPPILVDATLPIPEEGSDLFIRELSTQADQTWQPIESEQITIVVPRWAASEPVWSLLVLIAVPVALLAIVSLASTRAIRHRIDPYDDTEYRICDIQLVQPDGLGVSIVKGGLFTWRRTKASGEAGSIEAYVSLAWFVTGPLVARFQTPRTGPEDGIEAEAGLTPLLHRIWAYIRAARTLIVGRRIRESAVEIADGRVVEIQLVRRLDSQW